jgi:hypothetical protein
VLLMRLQMCLMALAEALPQAGLAALPCQLLHRPERSGCCRMSWPMNSQHQQQMT